MQCAAHNLRMYQMKTLPRGEAANLTIKSTGEFRLHLSHTVQVSKDSPRIQLEHWTFDFEDVPMEELQKLAAKTVKIFLQRQWRNSKDRMKADVWDNRVFKITDVVKEMGARTTADPLTAAERALDKLTNEELIELIKTRSAKLKK